MKRDVSADFQAGGMHAARLEAAADCSSEPILRTDRPQASRFQLQAIDSLPNRQLDEGKCIEPWRDFHADAGAEIRQRRATVGTVGL